MNLLFDFNGSTQDFNLCDTRAIDNPGFEVQEPKLNPREKLLHEKALAKSSRFKKCHAELLEVVMEVNREKLYEKFLLTSTFSYCTQILGLSKDVTCTLTTIARVSEKIPELKLAIDKGNLCISNARRIAPIVTTANKTEWIEKAINLPQTSLEKEVAKVFPKEAVKEKVKFISEKRMKIEMGLDEDTMNLFRRAQDLVSQKSRAALNLEETLKAVLADFVEKHDPVKKAERAENKKSKKIEVARVNTMCVTDSGVSRRGRARQKEERLEAFDLKQKRLAIPAHVLHQVNLRDQRKCQARLSGGEKCANTRWLDYHHKAAVEHGGKNTLENLTTLCAHHHRLFHRGLKHDF